MAIDPHLLYRALSAPEPQDVTATPIVRAIILSDPANAADLVPFLNRDDPVAARNARRVLAQFRPDAVPHLLAAMATTPSPTVRKEGIEVLWALLATEDARAVRESLQASEGAILALLGDASPLPDRLPDHVEREFEGRVCDLLYVVIRELLDPAFDQSSFRALDNPSRDEDIRRMSMPRFSGPTV